jgi:hypothetical protein
MNRMDKIFRNALSHHTEQVPADMWDKIESHLPRKRKRSYFPLFAAIVLCLVTAGSFFTLRSKELILRTGVLPQEVGTMPYSTVGSMYAQKAPSALKSKPISSLLGVNDDFDKNNQKMSVALDYRKTPVEKRASITEEEAVGEAGASLERLPLQAEVINQRTVISTPLAVLPVADAVVFSQKQNTLPLLHHLAKKPFFIKEKESKGCPFYFDEQNKSVDVYFSSDYGLKTLSSTDPALSEHLEMRNQTESARYSFSTGVRFGYNLSYRWNLHTGVNYSQINEKFEYTDPESNQTRIITIKDYVYENGKIIDSIITEEFVIVPGTTKMKIFNNYRTFDIPVIGRYTLFANRLFSLSGIAGIYLNLTSRQRGMILGVDNKTILDMAKATEEDAPLFKTQLGVSGLGGMSLALHLTPAVDFLLEPHARIFPSFMNTERYPANQKFTVIGVSTGIRYKF